MSDTIMMLAAAAAQVAAQASAQAPVVVAPSPSMLDNISPVFLLLWAGALCAVLAVLHSAVGEKLLIGPQLAAPTGVMENPITRMVTRIAWHWTSALWLIIGALLAAAAYGEVVAQWLLLAIGLAHVLFGAVDAALTRGRHVTWAPIALIGVLTLFSVYLTQ